MNRTMKRAISFFLALCMFLALSACGKKNPTPSAGNSTGVADAGGQTSEIPEPAPPLMPNLDNLIDPNEMEWGYDAPGSSDAQHWYPDGDKLSDYYLMFDGSFLYVRDGDTEDYYSVKVEDGHIVNLQEDGPELDFVFIDNLTCYDMINGQWYMRADYDAVMASLTASTFYCEAGDQWNITFYEDGTYSYNRDGELVEGEWWFQDANTINYIDDYGEVWFKITYAEGRWEIVSIKDTDVFYPQN